MTKWRIIGNNWNLKAAPWRDAIGIEEDDDSTAVPAVVCWFTRGWERPLAMAQSVVDEHNRNVAYRSLETFMPSWFQWFNIFGKLLPFIESAMQTIAQDTGKPLESTIEDIINHLTPGKPNSSSLNG